MVFHLFNLQSPTLSSGMSVTPYSPSAFGVLPLRRAVDKKSSTTIATKSFIIGHVAAHTVAQETSLPREEKEGGDETLRGEGGRDMSEERSEQRDENGNIRRDRREEPETRDEREREETRGESIEDAFSGGALPPLWSSAAMNPGADVMRCRCSASRQGPNTRCVSFSTSEP